MFCIFDLWINGKIYHIRGAYTKSYIEKNSRPELMAVKGLIYHCLSEDKEFRDKQCQLPQSYQIQIKTHNAELTTM